MINLNVKNVKEYNKLKCDKDVLSESEIKNLVDEYINFNKDKIENSLDSLFKGFYNDGLDKEFCDLYLFDFLEKNCIDSRLYEDIYYCYYKVLCSKLKSEGHIVAIGISACSKSSNLCLNLYKNKLALALDYVFWFLYKLFSMQVLCVFVISIIILSILENVF